MTNQSLNLPDNGNIVALKTKDDRRLYVIIDCKTHPYYTIAPVVGGQSVVVLFDDFTVCNMGMLLRRYEQMTSETRMVSHVHNKQYRDKRRQREFLREIKAISLGYRPVRY